MKFHEASGDDRAGFTIVEVLIVIGISAIIFALVGPIAFNFYSNYQFDSEYKLLGSLLRYARNLSMTNHNEADHGLYVDGSNFVVFQGPNYATRDISQDKRFPRNTVISVSGPTELVFTALSGRTASTTYSVSNQSRNWDVYVNVEGLV